MLKEKSELYTAIIFTSIAFFAIVAGLVVLVTLYYRRKRKHLEEKLIMNQQFESELLKTHIEVQEQTMQTIAADLHDNIGQLLSLTALTLNSIQLTDEEKANKKINDSQTLINKSIQELRELAKLLQGEQLIETGIGNAIQQEINWLGKTEHYQLEVENKLFELQVSSPNKDLIILRLVQEIINNIIKHAKADRIMINAFFENELIYLHIKDNGVGFDLPVNQVKGMGIHSLQKRTMMINGKIDIISSPSGTTINIEIPYP